jgi:hypothetical protein
MAPCVHEGQWLMIAEPGQNIAGISTLSAV